MSNPSVEIKRRYPTGFEITTWLDRTCLELINAKTRERAEREAAAMLARAKRFAERDD